MSTMTELPPQITPTPQNNMATYDARDLLKSGVQACIVLDDQTYFLRLTRAGKLILTK